MRRVVLIEDSLDAHNYVRDHAPADWEMLEAADGLSGLDLVRQWLPALDLVILDMMLPDVDGEYVCAQIRELSQTLLILPYTGKEEALPVLKDLACLPALIKPVLVPRLTQSLQTAFERPTPPVTESGALRFVRAELQGGAGAACAPQRPAHRRHRHRRLSALVAQPDDQPGRDADACGEPPRAAQDHGDAECHRRDQRWSDVQRHCPDHPALRRSTDPHRCHPYPGTCTGQG